MSKKKSLVRQAAVLSVSNGATRALGFVMRVALSRRLGAEGTGVLELASSAHMLWIAPVTAGLPMAVSTETAAGRGGEALHAGRRLALRVSLLMLPALFVLSPLIARLLGDARTLPALWCYLPCLPVLGLSAVYNGWCYGAGDTLPPAASELTEQALRFALCMGLLTVFPRMRAAYTAAVPALSTLLGEGAGLLLVVWMLKKQGTLPAGRASAETEKKLWRLSAPMTWMRLSNTLTRTAGAVLIPLRLRAAGLSAQEATARLGMLSGMAMPWVMLPGVFVSVANFTPELLPPELLYKVASAELATPLPLFMEALFVNFLLEIVREAGLRLPKPIGHSVSLVAALIVGDAAVSAGIVGTPVVIVAAMTAICTFVVPSLYEPITVLRILYILAGGLLGPLGIVTLLFCMLLGMCGMNSFGIPYTAPIAPGSSAFWRDGLLRRNWHTLARADFSIDQLPGKETGETQ